MSTAPVDTASPPRKPSGRQWVIPLVAVAAIGAVVGLGALAGGGDAQPEPDVAPVAPVADSTVTVLYEVDGSTDYADVTMETPDGTEQLSPDVPMVRKSDGQPGLEMEFSSGDFLYLSAQNNRSYGTVTCRITVDGVVVSENEASGGYAIATCKGSAG